MKVCYEQTHSRRYKYTKIKIPFCNGVTYMLYNVPYPLTLTVTQALVPAYICHSVKRLCMAIIINVSVDLTPCAVEYFIKLLSKRSNWNVRQCMARELSERVAERGRRGRDRYAYIFFEVTEWVLTVLGSSLTKKVLRYSNILFDIRLWVHSGESKKVYLTIFVIFFLNQW